MVENSLLKKLTWTELLLHVCTLCSKKNEQKAFLVLIILNLFLNLILYSFMALFSEVWFSVLDFTPINISNIVSTKNRGNSFTML